MQLPLALREKAAQLLAADTATFAQAADANLVRLLVGEFPETEEVVIGDLTFANFAGSAGLEAELGAQPEGLDPVTGDAIITISPPAGGWRWETTGLTNLPQTVTGFALVTDDSLTLLGVQRLEEPVTLNAVNQVINLDAITIRQRANSME